MKKILAAVIAIVMIFALCACGQKGGSDPEMTAYEIAGITYTLSPDWSYKEDGKVFTNDKHKDARYVVEAYWYSDDGQSCTTVEERKSTFEPDGSDGFELTDIEVNGEPALLCKEPVNEIVDCNVYFYVDGKEHIINYEPAFGDNSLQKYTDEFLASISW